MKTILTRVLDRVDELLDWTRDTLSETTRLTTDRLRSLEIHPHRADGPSRRRLRSLPLRYLSHPLFNTLMGGMLCLGVAVAGIAADDALAIWTVWLPLPLFTLVVLTAWFDFRLVRRGATLAAAAVIALGAIGVRLWVAMQGPVPHSGIREILDLFIAFAAGAAVWVTAGRQTIGVYLVWLAALGVMLLGRLGLSEVEILFRPDELPVIISLLWGFAALGGALSHRFDPPRRRRLTGGGIVPAHVLAACLGVALGIICHKYYLTTPEATARDQAGAIQRGLEAAGLLWARSLLFGWGRDVLPRLEQAITEPMSIAIPDWQGILGTLGSKGLSFVIGGALVSLILMRGARRRARIYGLSLSSAPQLALLAAQTFLGLILAGCPRSAVPWLILGCWTGLGFASGSYARFVSDPNIAFEDEESYSQIGLLARLACFGAVLAALAGGTLTALRPTLARHWTASITYESLREESLEGRLNRARVLAPWDPEVDLKDALRLREMLQAAPVSQWNERLYQDACDAYIRARHLDPLDPLIAIQHARLQDLAERVPQAQTSILRARETLPSSEPLVNWLYLQANRRRTTDVARAMIREGVRIAPKSGQWWMRLHATESIAGNGPAAERALGVALTTAPEDKTIILTALRASRSAVN